MPILKVQILSRNGTTYRLCDVIAERRIAISKSRGDRLEHFLDCPYSSDRDTE